MARLCRKKWSGREKRACAVENSDRGWQLTAQELGNDPKTLKDLFAWGL